MTYSRHGENTSEVEVTNVSTHGFWIMVRGEELFLPFETFPWFEDAPIKKLVRVELASPTHLYWPELDVDLTLDSILHPERFPLISAIRQDGGVDNSKEG